MNKLFSCTGEQLHIHLKKFSNLRIEEDGFKTAYYSDSNVLVAKEVYSFLDYLEDTYYINDPYFETINYITKAYLK